MATRQELEERLGDERDKTEVFGGWLRRQSTAVQDSVLGTRRAKMFRDGKLKIERYTDLASLSTMTLNKLEATRPEDIELDGVNPSEPTPLVINGGEKGKP